MRKARTTPSRTSFGATLYVSTRKADCEFRRVWRKKSQEDQLLNLAQSWQVRCYVVGAPGSGPRSFSWTDYWTRTYCLVKSSVPGPGLGPKLSVHRLTGPGLGPGPRPIKWKFSWTDYWTETDSDHWCARFSISRNRTAKKNFGTGTEPNRTAKKNCRTGPEPNRRKIF